MPRHFLNNRKSTHRRRQPATHLNFLERLVAYCTFPSRSVPPEPARHGVKFRVGAQQNDAAFVIIFHVDNGQLIDNQHKKPDYLVFYADSQRCIATIVELKSGRHAADGIDQILALRDDLVTAVEQYLPASFPIHYQGILLAPYNQHYPYEKIFYAKRRGLIVNILEGDHNAELYPYISKINPLYQRYVKQQLPAFNPDADLHMLEKLFINRLAGKVIRDPFFYQQATAHGIYLNFLRSNHEYLALSANPQNFQIGTKNLSPATLLTIKNALTKLGVDVAQTLVMIA
jgi:hypothetical protein